MKDCMCYKPLIIIDIMDKLMYMMQELKYIINQIRDKSEDYINNLPFYDKFQNQIEMVNKSKFKICIFIIIIIMNNNN